MTKWCSFCAGQGALPGDRRSQRIEAHAGEILGLVEATPDITLEEIAAHLAEAHGESSLPARSGASSIGAD